MHPDDQAFHRFLCRKNQSDPPTVYQWLRLNCGEKPAPDIASNAINTLAKASQREFPEAAKELQERTDVDDIGGFRPTAAEAKHVTTTVDEVLGKGQFQIKAWLQTARKSSKPAVSAIQICLVTVSGTSKNTFSLKKDSVVRKKEDFTKRSCLTLLAPIGTPLDSSRL